MQRTESPVVLITGAARKGRVGADLAQSFHAKGYNVIIHYGESLADARNLYQELCAERKDSAMILHGNLLSDDLDVIAPEMIERAAKKWGRLDVLINSASLFLMSVPGKLNLKDGERLMRINAHAPNLLMQAFAGYHDAAGTQGKVFNISDAFVGKDHSEGLSQYNASKLALERFTIDASHTYKKLFVYGLAPGAMLHPAGVVNANDVIQYEGTEELKRRIHLCLAHPEYYEGFHKGKIQPCHKGEATYPKGFISGLKF